MGFPDRIERSPSVAHRPAKGWPAVSTAEGLGTWFGQKATVDLPVGGLAQLNFGGRDTVKPRIERVKPPHVFGHIWGISGLPAEDPRRTYVEFTREPVGDATRLTVVESGSAQVCEDVYAGAHRGNTDGSASWASSAHTWMSCRDPETVAEEVFSALTDPNRRAILAELASRGPATATDLAGRLPITRQATAKHLTLLTDAGLAVAEPGERRRVRYRLQSGPIRVAQQFLAALARDWDASLDSLRRHLNL